MPPQPKTWSSERWNWAWKCFKKEMSGATSVHWTNSRGGSQGRYNPDSLYIWGRVDAGVKVMHFVSYCEEEYGRVPDIDVLTLKGEYYVLDEHFITATPRHLKWFYFGSDRTLKERAGRLRGKLLGSRETVKSPGRW